MFKATMRIENGRNTHSHSLLTAFCVEYPPHITYTIGNLPLTTSVGCSLRTKKQTANAATIQTKN